MATRTMFAAAAVLLSVPLVLGQECIVCGGPGQTNCDKSTKSCYECQRQALSMQSSPGMTWGGIFTPLDELITYVCEDFSAPPPIKPCTMLNAAGQVLVPDQKSCTECKQLCTTNSQCGYMVWNYIKVPASSVEAFDCSGDPLPECTQDDYSCGTYGQQCKSDCGFCGITTEATKLCFRDGGCDVLETCSSSTSCPSGYKCLRNNCCGEDKCVQECSGTSAEYAVPMAGNGPSAAVKEP